MVLNFTSRTMREFEQRTNGRAYIMQLREPSMTLISNLFLAGTDAKNITEADKMVDKELSEGKTIMDLYMVCMKELKKGGLLPKEIDIDEMEKEMEKEAKKAKAKK